MTNHPNRRKRVSAAHETLIMSGSIYTTDGWQPWSRAVPTTAGTRIARRSGMEQGITGPYDAEKNARILDACIDLYGSRAPGLWLGKIEIRDFQI